MVDKFRSITLRGQPSLLSTIDAVFAELDSLFSRSLIDLLSPLVGAITFQSTLPMEMYETGDRFVMRIELPGLEREDIDIRVRNGYLTIEAEKMPGKEFEEARRRETTRAYGRIYKSLTIPEYIDEGRITARYRSGVLTIDCPKKPQYEGRKVEIR